MQGDFMEKVINIGPSDFEMAYNRGMDFITECTAFLDLRVKNNIILAFEEVFVNILKYNEDKDDLEIDIKVRDDSKNFDVEISDNGVGFDPLKKEDPDITLDITQREAGGLGIFILKKITDRVDYKYENGHNVLTFGVKLNGKN